ncbi:hypothetical protein BS618_07610 [Rhodococcus erythropolis]|uniref:hypothetical protein n=1 Tax=Rhodococcus qingshengii TaxID=334542 RepID=UPI000937B2DC|nr:hypothetical protein [Rhodococcus qingshengii]MCZ4544942.1 hypothetical protein [Rhodococcus qingshengii]OKA15792.1 hypothetical protein BS618_07610 [Rhodococcus erythropolis]
MPNPTKPTTNLTREELRQAIRKDFHELLVKEFTADWKIQRLLHDLELDVMDFDNTMQLFDTYTQAKEREARMDEQIRYKQTLESAIETYPIDNDWCRGRRQGIQDCIDDQTEIISELAALKTKQEVAN